MKTLLIIRHAKSSWADPGQTDIERPLNDRGEKNAPEMAKRQKDQKLKIDLFVSSPAKRAHKTAKFFAEEFGAAKDDILIVKELYEAAATTFYKVVANFKDKHNTIALFSHNPGITDFVNTLTNVQIDNMPTCAVFAVSIPGNSWWAFKEAEKNFLFFDYPKKMSE